MIGYQNRPWKNQPMDAETAYRRRRQKRIAKTAFTLSGNPSIQALTDNEVLLNAYQRLRRDGGHAPGPDGITYSDLSKSEVANLTRVLAVAIKQGLYRPEKSRRVTIPKASGSGTRTLSIRDVIDRIPAKALALALSPFWEARFLPESFGFRQKLGVWDMLLFLEKAMITQDKWVIAQGDVANAFDNIRITDVMEFHRQHLTDQKLLNFIEVILKGGNSPEHNRGIEQGCPYSPTALNVVLHHAHDLGFRRDLLPSFARYADNLVYLTRDVPEGLQALSRAQSLLQDVGLTLKQEDRPIDLNQDETTLLGFQLGKTNGAVSYNLSGEAFLRLMNDLEVCHGYPNPPRMALQVMNGWLAAYGPTFKSMRLNVPQRILEIGKTLGFQEISLEGLQLTYQSSWNTWMNRRKAMNLDV